MDNKRYLQRNINLVDVEGRKAVARVLLKWGQQGLLRACAEGSALNLDAVPAEVLAEMVEVLTARMAARGRTVESPPADG